MSNQNKWISVSQAAILSRYHPETLRELIRGGRVRARKFSIVWMVERESLLKYMAKVQTLGGKRGPKPK